MADNLQIYGHAFNNIYGIKAVDENGKTVTFLKDDDDAELNDVVFLDYDGTIRYSYSASQFANLTQFPPNPQHTQLGLVPQGWNWDLAAAKTYVSKYGSLEIGQTYTTASGATEIDVHILDQNCLDVCIGLGINGVTKIDWGDESQLDTVQGTSLATAYYTTHIYSKIGKYTVKIKEQTGVYGFTGTSSAGSLLFLKSTHPNVYNENKPYHNAVKAIRIGAGCKIVWSYQNSGSYNFKNLGYLKYITMPKSYGSTAGVGNMGGCFAGCFSLFTIILPLGQTTCIEGGTDNTSIKWISLPNTVTVVNIGYNFRSNNNLLRLSTPQSVTDLGTAAFNGAGLVKIIIPDGVTNITGQFYVDSAKVILCTPTTPPTLQASNSTIAPDCVIYVPYSANHSVLTAYQQATNWSVFASQMEEYTT